MCHKAEGESDYFSARDKRIREKGYNAFHKGVPREDNPEMDHPDPYYSDKRQWDIGWEVAFDGDKLW